VSSAPLILLALRSPERLPGLGLPEWDLLLRQAASANLTATLLAILEERALLEHIPAPAREHFEWVRTLAARHRQAVRFEVARIGAALDGLGLPLLLLKGAAYAVAGLPPAAGRLFSDIDILVPKQRLGEVEAALMMNGWAASHHDDYDQRYYREWMHELPPLQHIRRQSLIDVHHAILPETAPVRPDPDKLRAAAQPVGADDGVRVLAPADMVLHSAVHLFYGEFDKGLRDLVDLHRLLLHFSSLPGFWDQLPRRAAELELARPLFYALRHARALLGTPVPDPVLAAAAQGRPNPALLALMDALLSRALLPEHASCSGRFTGAARFMLYVRANWLRMPPLLLARHLFHKAFISKNTEAA
jgi:hypothetical protein